MRSITDIIACFKQNWTKELSPSAITEACRNAGMSWYESALNPVVTIQIFFVQILHGNTACEHLSHLTGMSFTAAAYCKARMRVNSKCSARCSPGVSTSCTKRRSIRHAGSAIACFISTAPASRCPTRPSYRPTLDNLASRNPDVDFPRRIGLQCCTPARA